MAMEVVHDMTDNKYYEVILGALLHDIGKFYQKDSRRGSQTIDTQGKHPLISARFIEHFRTQLVQAGFDVDLVKEIVQRHHSDSTHFEPELLSQSAPAQYKQYCVLVDRADTLSSNERGFQEIDDSQASGKAPSKAIKVEGTVKDGGNYSTRTLTSIFSLASETSEIYGQSVGLYSDVADQVSPNNNKSTSEINGRHIKNFEAEFGKLDTSGTKLDYINRVDKLLEKYLWCIPCDAYSKVVTDISLYDHLKTTAALADVIFRQGSFKNNTFGLMQVTIKNPDRYTLKPDNEKGIKGKAGLLEAQFNHLISKLLTDDTTGVELQGTNCNLVYKSAYSALLVYNGKIDNMTKVAEANTRLIKETQLETYFEASYSVFSDTEIYKTYKQISEMQKELQQGYSNNPNKKLITLESILTSNGGWKDTVDVGDTKANLQVKDNSEIAKSHDTYAMVVFNYENMQSVLDGIQQISSDTINKWSASGEVIASGIELGLGTISRQATVYRSINNITNLSSWFSNGIMLSQNEKQSVILVPLVGVGAKIENYINKVNGLSIGTIKVRVNIRTLRLSDEIENVYRHLISDDSTADINYNGISLTSKDLVNTDTLLSLIRTASKSKSSALFKLRGYVREYKDYLAGKESRPICVSRYFHRYATNSVKLPNNELDSFIYKQFLKIEQGGEPGKLFLTLDTIITDALHIERQEED